jgi:hypothetical protein
MGIFPDPFRCHAEKPRERARLRRWTGNLRRPVLIVKDKRRDYGERRSNALGESERVILHVT